MNKTFNDYAHIYREQLKQGDIQEAYIRLVKYVSTLKTHCSKQLGDEFTFGNTFQGYMDYTYFYFFDSFLRSRFLRFGVVLNHVEMRFELWLLGQNAKIQNKYWESLKNTKWNEHQASMPKYSVLEVVLDENPNFDNLEALSTSIENEVRNNIKEIIEYLKKQKA